jgi:hypothetical protein
MCHQAMSRLMLCNNIEVLGGDSCERLPIFSMRIRHKGHELHYGFVVSLLNDLFGIQVRGGCSCAGPYAHTLLKMDMDYSRKIESAVVKGVSVLRPGWIRLNFNYFISDEEFAYLLGALELVAEFGWRLLPEYQYDPVSGVWRHQSRVSGGHHASITKPSVENIDWNTQLNTPLLASDRQALVLDCDKALAEAKRTLLSTTGQTNAIDVQLPDPLKSLRWFMQPGEARDLLRQMG